jgi:hypothetical protein
MRRRKSLSVGVMIVLLTSITAFGQTPTATLSGVIRDATGAVIADAKVSARNSQTGAMRETTSDGDGRYSITTLGPGLYEVRAERTGFKAAVQSAVVLTVGGAAAVDLTMQTGSVSEVVEIKEDEPLIETTRAELSRVVNQGAGHRGWRRCGSPADFWRTI